MEFTGSYVPATTIETTGRGLNGLTTLFTTLYGSVDITHTRPEYTFHLNADSLISNFVPTDVFSQLAASVAAAASAASVTGASDPTDLIYSLLEDTKLPPWFQAAVPGTYSTQMATLEAQISNLRADSLGSTALSPPQSVPTTADPTSSVTVGTTSRK